MEDIFNNILIKPSGTLTNEEYDLIKECSVHFPDGLHGKLWGDIIARTIDEVKNKEGINSVLLFIEDAYKELDRVYPQLFNVKSELLKKSCLLALSDYKHNCAHEKMERYLYNALSQVHYSAVNDNMPYYSFRSFSDYSIKDIANETISLAHPREFNDPLDTILVYWLNSEIKKYSFDDLNLRYRILMKKVAEHIKLRCLIAGKTPDNKEVEVEDLNVLMWAHYADSHKGFCVKYEFSSDLFDLSKYPKKDKIILIDKIKYSESIDIQDEPSIRMALLEKSDFWKYEDEMRLVSYDFSGNDNDFPTIECKGAIKAIYLGVKCSDSDRRMMEKAIGDKNIPLYQLTVDEDKLTRFKKKLIG